MKKVVMAVLLMAGIAGMAQESKERPEGGRPKMEKVTPDEQTKQLTKELGLDANQQAKVKALYTEQENKRAANKPTEAEKGEKHDHAAMEAKMKEENTAFDTKMKEVLTAEQYTKWQASLKNKKGAKHGGKKPTE